MPEIKASFGPRQRRIRHIRSIAGRNIVWKTQDIESEDSLQPSSSSTTTTTWLQPASTTHMKRSDSSTSLGTTAVEDSSLMTRAYQKYEKQQQHTCSVGLLDAYFTLHTGHLNEPEFYKSEMIPNTINPTFRALAFPFDWMNWYDAASSILVIRVWTRHAIPESAGLHSEPVLGYQKQWKQEDDGFELLIEWQLELNSLAWIGKKFSDLQYTFPENTLIFELEDGFYSAPDVKTFLTSQSKRSSFLLDVRQPELQKDSASIHTVNSIQSRKKRSYSYNNVMKLNTVMDCIFDTQKSSDEVRLSIQEILDQEERGFRLSRELNQHKSKLMEKESQVIQQKKLIQSKFDILKAKRQLLENRKIDIATSLGRCESGIQDLQENETVLEKNIKMRQTTHHTLNRRKKELIADLFSIYPIEQSFDDSQQFCIRGIYLPNSIYDGQNDELIATALGFTAHLVSMLAYYLEIPLRYPTVPMGSRAIIKDQVSLINGSRDFPLYAKGVDRYRFEFGVFLLNKNIEQMMNAYGLIVMDLRHTLPNIHYFIQAILTTSVTSGPTSMSVLSISSYANGARNNNHEERSIRQDHNHLTLQPTPSLPHPPSPSISTPSIHNNVKHSSKLSVSFPSGGFLNTPQAMAAPAILDAITTSSNRHSTS